MLTKGEIATQALKKIRISGLTSTPSPEDLIDSIQELDLLVGLWRNSGLNIPFSDTPEFNNPSANQISGVTDNNTQAVILNLAVNLCDFYGKQPSITLKQQAQMAYSSLFSIVMPSRDGNPYLPTGNGLRNPYTYSFAYNQFFEHDESAPSNSNTQQLAISDAYDYTISWDDWLSEGATVTDYTITASDGLSLDAHQLQVNDVYFKVTGKSAGPQAVDIQITSSKQGRVDNRTIYFNVVERKA